MNILLYTADDQCNSVKKSSAAARVYKRHAALWQFNGVSARRFVGAAHATLHAQRRNEHGAAVVRCGNRRTPGETTMTLMSSTMTFMSSTAMSARTGETSIAILVAVLAAVLATISAAFFFSFSATTSATAASVAAFFARNCAPRGQRAVPRGKIVCCVAGSKRVFVSRTINNGVRRILAMCCRSMLAGCWSLSFWGSGRFSLLGNKAQARQQAKNAQNSCIYQNVLTVK